jgi:tetratricopeptide (TPR) repeat protein
VQIHEVGEFQGRPYFALEYVDGSNLAHQLAGATLAPRAAAALVETIARTIHYAHERGIVHRDLTPRNILLARGSSTYGIRMSADAAVYEPKITDFGLAKELDNDASQTQTGIIMGTPSYMSPEQALGRARDISPATDIHALGAILYEALTGRPPFLGETSYDTLLQVIERDPVPPSRLQPGVPRDLETICLKCLSKDAAKRYATAEALADDLHRFLVTEPILARRVAWHERAWKWGRRHPAVAALLGVVLLAVSTLTVGSLVYSARVRGERDRAETNFQLAMQAVDEMLSEVGEEQLAAEPRMEEKRKALLAKALTLYREFLAQKSDDARVRLQTAQAHRRMADILRLLGQNDTARDAYGEAIVLLARLHAESPAETTYHQQIAYCHNMRGESLRAVGRHDEAENAYQQAEEVLTSLAAADENDPSCRQELARTLYNRGILMRQTQRASEAESQFRRAVALLGELLKRAPNSPALQQHLARAYLNLGTVIPSPQRFADAKEANDQAIATLVALSEKFPDNPDYRHELGVAYNNLGNLFVRTNRTIEAKTAFSQSAERFAALARDFPKVPAYRSELANSFNSTGSVRAFEKDHEGAAEAWQQAAALLEGLASEHGNVATYRGDLGMVLGNLGLAHHARAQWPAAREHLAKSIEHLTRVVAESPDQAFYRQVLRDAYQNLAEVLLASHDHAAAAKAARSLADVFRQEGRDRYLAVCFLARCAGEVSADTTLGPAEREALAQDYADEAMALFRQAVERGFRDVDQIEKDREHALQSLAARPDFQELVRGISGAQPES